ncbi:hypothetical protein BJF85_13660 [Saccharomonospora sp. CUA-673]|nr:hypothetical protein BJF85_13660 [Saccharomonospora sp. CUA-673]
MWVIIIGGALLMAAPMTVTTYAAGADWLMMRRTRWGCTTRVWVDLYELTKIRAHFIGGGYHLDLDDKDISLAVTFPAVQADRRIWDLIYNGILHSVANGATIDNVSIGVLNIQHTPALDIRNANNPDQT